MVPTVPVPTAGTASVRMTLVQPHIDSFNQLLAESVTRGIVAAPRQICDLHTTKLGKNHLSIYMTSIDIGYPGAMTDSSSMWTTPRECRERQSTYCAPMNLTCACTLHGGEVEAFTTGIGDLPIMVLSSRSVQALCNYCIISTQMQSRRNECSIFGLKSRGNMQQTNSVIKLPHLGRYRSWWLLCHQWHRKGHKTTAGSVYYISSGTTNRMTGSNAKHGPCSQAPCLLQSGAPFYQV